MTGKNRYLMLTVDTEALPKRAPADHVRRLIWGRHESGTAGIRQMCAVADEVNAKIVFFVDACGAYAQLDEIADVVRWLDAQGQDVQLHAHPEYLPESFWKEHGFKYRPRFMNQYGADKAAFTIDYFSKFLAGLKTRPLRAFRAGSFRWNADTLRALKAAGITLSFNNSMRAAFIGQSVYSEETNLPYRWSNGIIEVPMTERRILPFVFRDWWGRLQFPVNDWLDSPSWRIAWPYTMSLTGKPAFMVLLVHSWSLLYWDKAGYGVYKDDRRVEYFRKLIRRLAKDYDIITTEDFVDLVEAGKIRATHTTDIARAEYVPPPKKKRA